MLSTTACTFFSPQATLKHYDPSDGVGTTIGDVKVENAILLSKNGKDASFLVNFINDGDKDVRLLVQYDEPGAKGSKVDTTVRVGAGETKTFGSSDTRQLVFTDIDTKPGALFPVFVQYGEKTGKQLLVPVLDGSQKEYAGLLPTPTPTPTPTSTPSPSSSPTN
ncbi:MAG TPA: hypothetical protein VGC18_06030 [Lacisediminihabitans sp.]|uniref:hypothetical protein n=1 Tax=Lacisediminihabitans sp. TaxID=2787631 RepID=UPI002EDA73E1